MSKRNPSATRKSDGLSDVNMADLKITSHAAASTAAMMEANLISQDDTGFADVHNIGLIYRQPAWKRKRRQICTVFCLLFMATALASIGIFVYPYIDKNIQPIGDATPNEPDDSMIVFSPEFPSLPIFDCFASTNECVFNLTLPQNKPKFDHMTLAMTFINPAANPWMQMIWWYWDYSASLFIISYHNSTAVYRTEAYDFKNDLYKVIDISVTPPIAMETTYSELSGLDLLTRRVMLVDGVLLFQFSNNTDHQPITHSWTMDASAALLNSPLVDFNEVLRLYSVYVPSSVFISKIKPYSGLHLSDTIDSCYPNYDRGAMSCVAAMMLSFS